LDYKKKILKLAIPSIVENILQVTLSAVDTFFVATLGSLAISSVGVNTLISNLFLTFFIAIGTGVSIMTARADGEDQPGKVKASIQNAVILLLLINLILLIMNIFLGRPILMFLTKDDSLLVQSEIYFKVVIIPIIFLSFMTILSSIIKALGDTITPMFVALFINLINVFLDALLIPRVGLVGAGIATTVSRVLGMFILLYILHKKTGFLISFKLKLTEGYQDMVLYSIPVGLEKLSMRVGQIIYGGLILSIGITHYAAHQIAGTIESYSYLPAMGFGVASFSIIGHLIGEHKYDQVRKVGKLSFKFSMILMSVIGLVFFLYAPHLASLFTQDKEISRLVVIVLRIIALFQPFLCSTQVMASSLQALGDVKYSFYLTTFGIWFIRIFGTILLGIQLKMGLIGVWIAYAMDVTLRGSLLYIRFYKKSSTVSIERSIVYGARKRKSS
jgi:putative MATE family efflux protein